MSNYEFWLKLSEDFIDLINELKSIPIEFSFMEKHLLFLIIMMGKSFLRLHSENIQ